jgi:hypothetical protein
LRYDGSGADEGVTSNFITADDSRIGANRRPTPDDSLLEFRLAGDKRARVQDICEHAARAAENLILENETLIEADVVLDLAAVADCHVRTYHHVLTNRTTLADRYPAEHVAKMPNHSVRTNGHWFVDVRACMNPDPRETSVVTPLIGHRWLPDRSL